MQEPEVKAVQIMFRQLTKVYAGTAAEYETILPQYRYYLVDPKTAVAAFKAEAPGVKFDIAMVDVLWSRVPESEKGIVRVQESLDHLASRPEHRF